MSEEDASSARIVADADVLAADLLVGGAARDALDHCRRHSWVELVATPQLLDDAEGVIRNCSDGELAMDWRDRIEELTVMVSQSEGDHPALAAAYNGNAAHLLSFDDTLTSARANQSLQAQMTVSVRPPDAFAQIFDPTRLYESLHTDSYSGPDRDPRA